MRSDLHLKLGQLEFASRLDRSTSNNPGNHILVGPPSSSGFDILPIRDPGSVRESDLEDSLRQIGPAQTTLARCLSYSFHSLTMVLPFCQQFETPVTLCLLSEVCPLILRRLDPRFWLSTELSYSSRYSIPTTTTLGSYKGRYSRRCALQQDALCESAALETHGNPHRHCKRTAL